MQKQGAFIQASLSSIPHAHRRSGVGRESELQQDKGLMGVWGRGRGGLLSWLTSIGQLQVRVLFQGFSAGTYSRSLGERAKDRE